MTPILARFKDIPFEEVAAHTGTPDTPEKRKEWNILRGGLVWIWPHPHGPNHLSPCEGPFYVFAESPHLGGCPHIIEVGD